MFELAYQRIVFRSGLRTSKRRGQLFLYAAETERPLWLESGKEHELELYIEDAIALLFLTII